MQRDGRNRGGRDRAGPPDLMALVSKARQRLGEVRKIIAEGEGHATEQVNRAEEGGRPQNLWRPAPGRL